jgi:hypothetical protein
MDGPFAFHSGYRWVSRVWRSRRKGFVGYTVAPAQESAEEWLLLVVFGSRYLSVCGSKWCRGQRGETSCEYLTRFWVVERTKNVIGGLWGQGKRVCISRSS